MNSSPINPKNSGLTTAFGSFIRLDQNGELELPKKITKKWLNNEISNDYAKDIMSNKLKKLIKIWGNSRN